MIYGEDKQKILYLCARHRLLIDTSCGVEKKFLKIVAGAVSAMGRRLKIAPPWLFMTTTVIGGRSALQNRSHHSPLATRLSRTACTLI
jgi:hypothetical protein